MKDIPFNLKNPTPEQIKIAREKFKNSLNFSTYHHEESEQQLTFFDETLQKRKEIPTPLSSRKAILPAFGEFSVHRMQFSDRIEVMVVFQPTRPQASQKIDYFYVTLKENDPKSTLMTNEINKVCTLMLEEENAYGYSNTSPDRLNLLKKQITDVIIQVFRN